MHEVLNELVEYRIVLEKAYNIIHGIASRGVNESMHSEQHEESQWGKRMSAGGRRSIGLYDIEDNKGDDLYRSSRAEQSFREVSIRYVSGTIDKEEVMRFKRILYRATRGKVL